jgi:hypothetical protein
MSVNLGYFGLIRSDGYKIKVPDNPNERENKGRSLQYPGIQIALHPAHLPDPTVVSILSLAVFPFPKCFLSLPKTKCFLPQNVSFPSPK